MLGPGVMRTEEQAAALILKELQVRGRYAGALSAGGVLGLVQTL